MALTLSSTTPLAITMTAGAGDATSSDIDLSTYYPGRTLRLRFTNAGTLGVAAKATIQMSEDTTSGNYITVAVLTSTLVSGDVTSYCIDLPPTAHLRIVSGSNTTNNVALRAVIDGVTGI